MGSRAPIANTKLAGAAIQRLQIVGYRSSILQQTPPAQLRELAVKLIEGREPRIQVLHWYNSEVGHIAKSSFYHFVSAFEEAALAIHRESLGIEPTRYQGEGVGHSGRRCEVVSERGAAHAA